MKKKLPKWVNLRSNTLGLWTNLRVNDKEESPSISPFGNSKPPNITSPSSMPRDTEISSRTWSLVLPKLIVPSLWSLHPQVNSKPVSQKTDKPENMPFSHSPLVSSKWSFAWTKLMKNQSTILKKDIYKSKKKLKVSWKKLVTNQMKFHSSQSQDGVETTCWKDQSTPHGTKAQSWLKPLIKSFHQKDQLKSHWDFHFKTSTKSVVSVPSQSEELKPVFLNQECKFPSPQEMSRLKLNQSKCITHQSQKPFRVTTSDSTLKVSQSRTSREDTFAAMPRTTHQEKPKASLLKSSSWTTQVKLKTDIARFWIATLPILLASLQKSNAKLTEEQENPLKKNQSQSRTETLPW